MIIETVALSSREHMAMYSLAKKLDISIDKLIHSMVTYNLMLFSAGQLDGIEQAEKELERIEHVNKTSDTSTSKKRDSTTDSGSGKAKG